MQKATKTSSFETAQPVSESPCSYTGESDLTLSQIIEMHRRTLERLYAKSDLAEHRIRILSEARIVQSRDYNHARRLQDKIQTTALVIRSLENISQSY